MKCKNPACKDPDFMDKCGNSALEFYWCPKCGASTSSDTNDTEDLENTQTSESAEPNNGINPSEEREHESTKVMKVTTAGGSKSQGEVLSAKKVAASEETKKEGKGSKENTTTTADKRVSGGVIPPVKKVAASEETEKKGKGSKENATATADERVSGGGITPVKKDAASYKTEMEGKGSKENATATADKRVSGEGIPTAESGTQHESMVMTTAKTFAEATANSAPQSGHLTSKAIRKDMPNKACMKVVFHALLSPHFQLSEGDHVVVRGELSLDKDDWNSDQLQMKSVRKHDEYILMVGEMEIPLSLACNKMPYKYAVVKQGEKKPMWEEVFGHPFRNGSHTNRCLVIPEKYRKSNETWNQYDDCVYCQPKYWSKFFGLLKYAPNPADGRYLAMEMMLPDWDKFDTETNKTSNATEALQKANQVIYCMENKMIKREHAVENHIINDFSIEEALWSYIKPKLSFNASVLSSKEEKTHVHRLATSLAITAIMSSALDRHMTYRPMDDDLKTLFKSLAINTELGPQKLNWILERLAEHYSKNNLINRFSESVLHLCQFTINEAPCVSEWLLAMPLVHFLTESSKPYTGPLPPLTDPADLNNKSYWGIHTLCLKKNNERWSSISFLLQIKSLFGLDPLLQRTFLLSLPLKSLGDCANVTGIPAHEICWTLAKVLRDKGDAYLTSEEESSINDCRNFFNETVELAHGNKDGQRKLILKTKELLSLSLAARQVLVEFSHRIGVNIDFICGFLLILGKMLVALKKTFASANENDIKDDNNVNGFCENLLKESLGKIKQSVGRLNSGSFAALSHNSRGREIEIYSKLYEIEISDEMLSAVWEDGLKEHLKSQIDTMSEMQKIEFYSKEQSTKFHIKVEEIFKEAAFDAIKTVAQTGRKSDHTVTLKQINTSQDADARKVGELMSLLLEQSWPKDVDKELKLLEHILTWTPLADYLRFFSRNSKYFTDDASCLLWRATSLLEAIQQKIRNETIKVGTLRVLKSHTPIFFELVALVGESTDEDDGDNDVDGCELLKRTFQLLEVFEKEQEELKSFLEIPFISQKVEIQDIADKVNTDFTEHNIQNLAVYIQENVIQVIFFEISITFKEMISKLHVLFEDDIFQNIWKQNERDIAKDKMSLEMVLLTIWEPTYKECQTLLCSVFKGDIQLKDVDSYFEAFVNRYDELERSIAKVANACGITVEEGTISNEVAMIRLYHRRKACLNAANKILEFAEKMGLEKREFADLEELRLEMSPESNQEPLKSLRDDFHGMEDTLRQLSPEKIACLDAIMNSIDFIEWLRKEVPEPNEIKFLVDLAMISGGEGDMESDRIRALHTSIKFKPVIYDLQESYGFKELMELFERIWTELEDYPNIPQQLTDTARNLEWVKNVKDFHGSVAMSSLKQVETILDHGIITIGCRPSDEESNIDQVVTVRIPVEQAKGLQKETYLLKDLEDLQSKLMLIAGKASGKKDVVDKFNAILQGAITVGTVYLNLYDAGEVSHLNWSKEFCCASRCGRKDVIEDLKETSDVLTGFLKAWNAILHTQRAECDELNYFTAKQLLYLRKEIADLKRGRKFGSLEVQIYTLLHNVQPGLNGHQLHQGLICIDIDVDDCILSDSHTFVPEEARDQIEHNLRERYRKFFENAEKADYSEDAAIAAIVACDCPIDESELLMWCIMNGKKGDVIDDWCGKGFQDPKFKTLFPTVETNMGYIENSYEEMEVDQSHSDTDEENFVQKLDQTLDGRYLSLQELSTLLRSLRGNQQDIKQQMVFPKYLKTGAPNLMIVPQNDIWATIIGLYESSDVAPTRQEVLVCTEDTSLEEVELFWRRVLANKGDKFYCLASVDKLKFDCSVKAKHAFDELEREYSHNNDYQLVVICSSEQQTISQLATDFDKHRVEGRPRCPRPKEVEAILKNYFKAPPIETLRYGNHEIDWIPASDVEIQISKDSRMAVLVISSERAGTGKTLVIKDFIDRLNDLDNNRQIANLVEDHGEHVTNYIVVPLHGKTADVSETVGFLLPYSLHADIPLSRIFHFDVSPTVEFGVDALLFNLLYLGSIKDKRGRVWNRNPRDLYVVEMSLHFTNKSVSKEVDSIHHHFYNELPSIRCITPREARQQMQKTSESKEYATLFNDQVFRSEAVQRVFQYLQHLNNDPEILHRFQFDPKFTDMDVEECLRLLATHCGVHDPSWSELQYFVDFLNYQLSDFECSVFCQMENIDDTLEGFRLFVVVFMTVMSQDFSTRSLGVDRSSGLTDEDEDEDIGHFELRRKWENSHHPYLFFNHPDHETFTFLGFRVDPDGNLVDPTSGGVIKANLMSRRLRTGLHVQRVNFEENFDELEKDEKIAKICRVLGVEWPSDPDESYELTEDNAKKMLAIHMRFRCGIPVVIMGETGCGKTKLIRYLCGLQSGFDGPKNMLLVKVHGGTTFSDIEKKVHQAIEMAKENIKNNVETVLFFDEVNTTEAMDLVKEVMVDHRLNGRPLGEEANGLRFIAACNPYRKHTDTMISKLESAGLGYNVKTEIIRDRIGRVPLRHLVYRVHALPESMRLLIWDFGQLKPEIEILYTMQIVRRHLKQDNGIPHDERLVEAIASVLAESQRYMREQKDECSFVSLRDVERTMSVMLWFYEHRDVFEPLLVKMLSKEDFQVNGSSSSFSDSEESVVNTMDYFACHLKANEVLEPEVLDDFISVPSTSGLDRAEVLENSAGKGKRSNHPLRMVFGKFPIPEMANAARKSANDDWDDDEDDDDSDGDQIKPAVHLSKEVVNEVDDLIKPIDPITWSLILAIGVCYHAKLQQREQYRQEVARAFRHPCSLYGGADRILQEISRCQKVVLEELELGPNIARNAALSENVFMMVVCIELRIPLFVIGKPGSSKSLAKTVVADNMQGDASKSRLFRSFKEVQMSAHQCSPQSTPQGIHDTFRQCSNLQKGKNPDRFVSVVVLDEVGLAEDSPLLPLKTLHPLLEDGVTSSDDIIETNEKPTRVAFIGISNWALDPAKMNRGILLSRDVPDRQELEDSAMGICASDRKVQEQMAPIIPYLANAYLEVYEEQKHLEVLKNSCKDEFFGLRDFYSLIKMIFTMTQSTKGSRLPGWDIIGYAVRRNFGGLQDKNFDPVEIFMKHLNVPRHVWEDEKKRMINTLDLIKSSLDKDPSEEDSRYLLILTENHAALSIVQQHLKESRNENDGSDPVLIFGSNFPKDLEYTQVCRNINDIKVCMETGRTVILLNMERLKLYEGLYDALNQYYVHFGGNKYVDLGLGSHRFKCRVDPKFRLIIIAEKSTVYNEFPIPLINRLEKHFLVLSTSLSPAEQELVLTLRNWVDRFADMDTPQHQRKIRAFTKGDAFVGYHEDSIPSVVHQVCSNLRKDEEAFENDQQRRYWEEKVLSDSKRLLVQCCPPDAIVRVHSSRLKDEEDQIWNMYFKEQKHSSLAEFLKSKERRGGGGLLIQVSTHSRLLSDNNLEEVAEALNVHRYYATLLTLQQFQTELQFCDQVGKFFAHLGGEEGLLVVQCISADTSFNLLACARHLLLKLLAEFKEDQEGLASIHIVVIIQLPRTVGGYPDFVGFQGQDWESVHIDELFAPSLYVPSLENVKDQSLSELFAASIKMCYYDSEDHVLDGVDVLRQCIQSAAQRINDASATVNRATRRIVIMLDQLSKEKTNKQEYDIQSFPFILMKRVHELLRELDERTVEQGKKWATTEAMDHFDLQEAGTYRRALWRKIQNAVVPILSELITFMDTSANLELLQENNPWLTALWLQLFQNNNLVEVRYSSFLTEENETIRRYVPVTTQGRDGHVFQCRLPFSWLIKEKMDGLWESAKGIAENSPNNDSVEECLRKLIASSDVSAVMETVNRRQEAVERYIHDFVHMNYKPLENGENELIARAIIITTRQLHENVVGNSEDFNFPDVALVHKAYSRIEEHVVGFSHLVRCQPSIVRQLLDVFTVDETDMTLDAIALQICLESLEPLKVNMAVRQKRHLWVKNAISVRAPAETMMGELKDVECGAKRFGILNQCSHLWERITAVRLLIEHVYTRRPNDRLTKPDPKHIQVLCKALDEETDFSRARSIKAIEFFLLECIQSFSSPSNEFLGQCNEFFMELVSVLCFGGKDKKFTLDQEVFDIFMRYITGSGSSQTKDFSPFPDFEIDKTPVVRSFLLQKLLTTSNDGVKKYIQRYLAEARGLSSDENHLIHVCQLTIDCVEDSFTEEVTERNLELSLLIGVSNTMISKFGQVLTRNQNSEDLDIDVLESIANVRHTLALTAEWLFKSRMTDDITFQGVIGKLDELLESVKSFFSGLKHSGPQIYLLKQLARRYGGPVVSELIRNPGMEWLIPMDLQGFQFNETAPDRFVAHGEMYAGVRDALAHGLMSGNYDGFIGAIKNHDNQVVKDILCLLSVYKEITCGYRQPRNKFQEHQELQEFLELPDNLSTQARQLAAKLLENSQGVGFSALSAQPHQPRATVDLAEVVVHTMIVLQCCGDHETINTLRSLMDKPDAMKESFLPTMPEDDFEKVRSGLNEHVTWYECPSGHRYSIGDCGQANQESRCPECKSGIGGSAYILLPGNKASVVGEDRSCRGHILGQANPNTSAHQADRDSLSPASFFITRFVMHSAILIGACRHPADTVQLLTPAVDLDRLNEFVWAHLTRDLHCLAGALNRSEDEALLTVHSVLKNITHVCSRQQSMFFANGTLATAANRRQWEKEFTATFIEPILSKLSEELLNSFDIMAKYQPVGSDRLMREIYETNPKQGEQLDSMHPCFWRYRAKITVEHAKQMFSEKMGATKMKSSYRVLREFFLQEHKLRLACNIPAIYKLQRFLIDNCSKRLDLKKAEEMTVRAFQKTLNDSKQSQFKSLLKSFRSAWQAVSSYLHKEGRFKLSNETCKLSMNDETPLLYLLPCVNNGHQSCTTAVLFYLVKAHNEFLETSHSYIVGSARDVPKIPNSEITSTQMVCYDVQRDLLPLIHTHCQYSLEVGQGTKVDYDWSAIERHVIDRLIRGKSIIVFKEAPFSFLKQNDAENFGTIREKISQENLAPIQVKLITADLRRLNDVCDVKQTLELAIGFLVSSGGDPKQAISKYLHDVLQIPRERGVRNKRAEEYCELRHIIHLWQIVTLERAKMLQRQKEDPFQDLQERYKVMLPNTLTTKFNKILKSTDVTQLCLDLVEIITLNLNSQGENFEEASLQEYLTYFLEDERFTGLDIPDEIQLKHIMNAWQLAVKFQSYKCGSWL